jgi:hypothetical protein
MAAFIPGASPPLVKTAIFFKPFIPPITTQSAPKEQKQRQLLDKNLTFRFYIISPVA